MASPPRPKPKYDSTTLIIYGIIGVVILIACILLGGAMDCSLDATGHIDATKLGDGFNYVASHPSYITSHITDKNSYIPKMLFVGVTGIGIYALYKYSEEKKRLHRRGTEHGSAQWGDAKEMAKLADPAPRKLHPIKVYDRYDFKIDWEKPDHWKYENETYTILSNQGDTILAFSVVHPEEQNTETEKVDTNVNSEPAEKEELQDDLKYGTHIEINGQQCLIDASKIEEDGSQKIESVAVEGHRTYDDKGNFVGAMIDNNIVFSKELALSLNAHQHLLNHNVLVVGGSGAGKTRFYALPNIMQMNTSYVVTDPKGEILMKCGEMLKAAGYKVKVFNTIEMSHSNNYNPFHYIYDESGQVSEVKVKKVVNALFEATKGDGEKDDMWSQKGRTVIEAIVYLLCEESEYNAKKDRNGQIIPETRDESHLNFFSVTEKMRRLQYPPRGSQDPDGFFLTKNAGETDEAFEERRAKAFLSPLDRDFLELEKRKPNSMAMRLYKEIRNAPEETGQGFVTNANNKTSVFNMKDVKNLTCCDNIHLETLGDEKTALFIIISATDRTFNFLAAMLFTQLFDTLSDRANFLYDGHLPVHVRCIIDEFANIGQIPDFDLKIAFVRSMGMSLSVILQAQSQLKTRYEKSWETIIGCCDTFLFLGGQEESTLKSLSEKLGKETIDVQGHNRTKGRQSSTSENNSILGRELLQTNELNKLAIDDCLVLMRSHNPFYCKKYPLEQHPNYQLLGGSGSLIPPFKVAKVHSVTYEEFEASEQAKQKLDTSVNSDSISNEETETEKETVIFRQANAAVSSDSILPSTDEEDAPDKAEQETEPDVEVTYNTYRLFDIPQAMESVDFGEAIIVRKEDEEDAEIEITSGTTFSLPLINFAIPDEAPVSEENLTQEMVESISPHTTEHSASIPTDLALAEDSDYHSSDDELFPDMNL